ncbi:hypothetical protein B0A48_13532 [Cryoendolithus antarcticus]|uniref:NAD-dependent epimerase/dehydratase domain-containing protein n=1 Tax=Cryoendolithus antarcticus TaxID=1507870 RepID=A0A1V8SNW0_9PEZI|nr:hypothetical protein B0A48_13532 [Cryoendolithus antarcticus]
MPSQLVLITGATGHIGFRVLVLALKAGYQVRASVRTEAQIKKLSNTPSVKAYPGKVEFVLVKDITIPNAYREALEGVTDVIHVASPIPSAESVASGEKPSWTKVFYDPALKGTLSLLESAKQTSSVRRVIITSSVIVTGKGDGKQVDPYSVSEAPPLEAAEQIEDVFQAYAVSKIMSHQAATDFVKQNKVAFDLVRVLPGYTQGENELAENLKDLAAGSNGALLATLTGELDPNKKLMGQVLLEDVAKAHVLALDPKIAPHLTNFAIVGNNGAGIPWDELAETAERLYPDEVKSGVLKPVKGQQDLSWPVDVSSSEKALGFKFAGGEEMVKSLVGQYLALAAK